MQSLWQEQSQRSKPVPRTRLRQGRVGIHPVKVETDLDRLGARPVKREVRLTKREAPLDRVEAVPIKVELHRDRREIGRVEPEA